MYKSGPLSGPYTGLHSFTTFWKVSTLPIMQQLDGSGPSPSMFGGRSEVGWSAIVIALQTIEYPDIITGMSPEA
jgi:hypothetical protein